SICSVALSSSGRWPKAVVTPESVMRGMEEQGPGGPTGAIGPVGARHLTLANLSSLLTAHRNRTGRRKKSAGPVAGPVGVRTGPNQVGARQVVPGAYRTCRTNRTYRTVVSVLPPAPRPC